LAFAFSINQSIWMGASISITISSVLMVAVIAHSLSIVLLIFMRAFHNLHSFSRRGILNCALQAVIWLLLYFLLVIGNSWVYLLFFNGSEWFIGLLVEDPSLILFINKWSRDRWRRSVWSLVVSRIFIWWLIATYTSYQNSTWFLPWFKFCIVVDA